MFITASYMLFALLLLYYANPLTRVFLALAAFIYSFYHDFYSKISAFKPFSIQKSISSFMIAQFFL